MAPNGSLEGLNCLINRILKSGASETKAQSINSLRKKLQSIIFFPPQSEPSSRETRQKWERVLERRRIENQTIVAEELEKRDAELRELVERNDTDLWKHVDSIREFLLALHSPPGPENYAVAINLREAEKMKLHVETQAEIDLKLYKTIMESEPLVGDHWQTDIYAGSSASSLDSPPSSDWNSDSESRNEKVKPVSVSNDFSKSISKENALRTSLELSQAEEQNFWESNPSLEKLQDLTRDAYWLKSTSETARIQLPELIVLREVLAALLNVCSDMIYTISADSTDLMMLSANAPTLISQSQATSLSLLSSFLPILNSLKKLRNQSQLNYRTSERKSPTEEAFDASLLVLLQSFDIYLTSIELQLLNCALNPSNIHEFKFESVASLMCLYHQLDQNGWIELFTTLACATPELSTPDFSDEHHNPTKTKVLLDKLYKLTCHFDSHCNSTVAVERMKTVFLKTCEPVWMWVGDWILHGRLPDHPLLNQESDQPLVRRNPNFDFFIGGNTSSASDTAKGWWDDVYFLRENSIPDFLQDFAGEIFEGGKAKAMLHILMIFTDSKTPQWPTLAKLMLQSPQTDATLNQPVDPRQNNGLSGHLRRTASRCPKKSENIPSIPVDVWAPRFPFALYSHIKQHLLPLISVNHSCLHARFFSPFKLSTYMNELNNFFLLGSESSVHFLKQIFDDANDFSKSSLLSVHPILNATHWWEDQVINANLSKALEYSSSTILSSCLLKVKTSPSIRFEEDPMKCLPLIEITFSIPTPLNYVFDSACVATYYNKCFVFLSQLAWAAWTLDSLIWIKPTLPLGSYSSLKEFEKRCESIEFYRLKNRLAWFVNLMTDYCLNLVILKWKINIVEAIDRQVGDLSHTIHHTQRWLDRLVGLMFLSDQCQPLNQVILQVLGLCTKSHATWARFNRRANTLRLIEDINQTYVNTERRKRKIERRRRRIRNEQYALIEEESRHVDINLEDTMNSPTDEALINIDGKQIDDDQSFNPENLSVLSSPPETLQPLQHLSIIDQDQDNYLIQFQKMNSEFEKLLVSFQRGVGKLCRKVALKSDKKDPTLNNNNNNNDDDDKTCKNFNKVSLDSLSDSSGDSEELDTLTLLECRLDEWIV